MSDQDKRERIIEQVKQLDQDKLEKLRDFLTELEKEYKPE